MNKPTAGNIFHRAIRDCMSEARVPTQLEVEQIAEKIWSDAFSRLAGAQWKDVPSYSTVRQNIMRAALAALGVGPAQLSAQ
ncbi:MAG: hypothetical protein QHC67_17510 [Sphingobium sp.]|uniref:hypothetical protein n=1 Tax=Sphingobium sp. TaxID=1912891 RepID=UPI0029B35D0A|nr:hypothetical protein [Sphingobium sp.]MDX3911584.1 hypothetical protein [Sphingobium sp.]